jgi:hypothetical protein
MAWRQCIEAWNWIMEKSLHARCIHSASGTISAVVAVLRST